MSITKNKSSVEYWGPKIREHFIPWLLSTPTFDVDKITNGEAPRPLISDTRHRFVYIPAAGRVGFSIMASFDKKDQDVELLVSVVLWKIAERPPFDDLAEFSSGALDGAPVFSAHGVVADPASYLRVANQIVSGVEFEILGMTPGDICHMRCVGREKVEEAIRKQIAEDKK